MAPDTELRAPLPGTRPLRTGPGFTLTPVSPPVSLWTRVLCAPLLGGALLRVSVVLLLARLYCCESVPDIAVHFGTKTRYEDTVGPGPGLSLAPPGCSPVHVTAVIRHGTRFPTVKNIRRIERLSRLVQTQIPHGHEERAWVTRIREWKQWYTEDMDGRLVEKGRADLRELAMRLVGSFPALLSEAAFKAGDISVRTSSKHRCVSSAEAFQDGLSQAWDQRSETETKTETGTEAGPQTGTENGPQTTTRTKAAGGKKDVVYVHEVDDVLMRSFERCRGYVEGVETNATATEEVERFKHGPELRQVRTRVSERLGLDLDLLTPDLVEAAFFICSYELAIKSLHSPWCELFTKDDAKVLEYKSDLKQYWKRSHGHSITALSSCPLFHHIFRTLDKAGRPRRATDTPPEPASILIGHAETLLPLIALLGLYKDKSPPTADNYQSQHDRVFRSSLLVPYASNLLFVLWDCPRGPRVRLFLNESPVRFPGLAQDLPLYRDVRATYRHLLDGCDFYKECEGRPSRAPNTEL